MSGVRGVPVSSRRNRLQLRKAAGTSRQLLAESFRLLMRHSSQNNDINYHSNNYNYNNNNNAIIDIDSDIDRLL